MVDEPRWVAPPPAGVLAVDFDGVLRCKNGSAVAGAIDGLRRLRLEGFRIFIHTLRARSTAGEVYVRRWLLERGIPFDDVTALKPDADFFIDDKAVRFTTWAEVGAVVREGAVRGC